MYSINQLYSIIRTYLYHFLILHYQKKPNLSLSILHLRQDVRVNTVNFFKKGLSCTMEIGAVKEERSGCFDLLTTTTNGFQAKLEIMHKLMICQMAQCQTYSYEQFYFFGIMDIKILIRFWLDKSLLSSSIHYKRWSYNC